MIRPRSALLAVLLALSAARAGAAGPSATGGEPVLASPPVLKAPVAAQVPPGTAFPAAQVNVLLSIDVSATGAVEAVRLAAGAGEPFDAAALQAAQALAFEPGRLTSGEAVPVTIDFRLRFDAPPPPDASPPPPPPPAPVKLVGRLLQRGTRKPLVDVVVAARSAEQVVKATTGADGRFTLQVPAASFRLVAVPAGHDRLDVPVDARPGEEREETYYLERSGDGNETVVRAEPVRREITRQVIPAEEVAKVAGSQGDTIKAVLNLPGVARTSFGEIILRGSAPGDSRYFVEGQEIPLLYHFGGLRSTINPRFLEAVEFVPGNFAPDYGRATGGIVEVRLRDPATDLWRGQVDVNLYDAGVAVEGPAGGGWGIGAAFHRSWIDTLLPLVIPKDANLSFDSAPRYYDYQFIASRKLGDQSLRLLWYGSMDKVIVILKRPGGNPKITGTISARTMYHAVQARLAGEVLPGLRQETTLQLAFSQFRTQFGPEFFFDLAVPSGALRSAWTLDLARSLQVRAGVDIDLAGVTIDLNAPTAPKEGENSTPVATSQVIALSKKTSQFEPAAFAELRWEPLAGLLVLPGVRVDHYSQTGRSTLDPRLGVRWEARPGTTLKAGVGQFQEPPQPDESAPDVGNPHLLSPRATHWSAGVEQKFLDGLQGEATGYYKQLSRLVVRNTVAAFDPSAEPYVNDGTGRVYGLEATLKARFGEAFFGSVAYTYQRAFRTDHPGIPERRFDYDQPHILTTLGNWKFSKAWSAGFRFRLVSGNPVTPVTGSVFDAASGTYVPVYGPTNSARLPAFNQLDVRVDRTWTYRTWKLVAYLDVQNVYNQGNVEGYEYNYDYAQRTPATGLPILPILGLTAEW